jgi:hypothetical protein
MDKYRIKIIIIMKQIIYRIIIIMKQIIHKNYKLLLKLKI